MMENNIPESFKIANQDISVSVVKETEDDNYGYFCDATNTVVIAKTVKVNNKPVNLSNKQLRNTFWHEVFHVFQFYYNNKYDEAQAQVFANFMCELEESTDKPF